MLQRRPIWHDQNNFDVVPSLNVGVKLNSLELRFGGCSLRGYHKTPSEKYSTNQRCFAQKMGEYFCLAFIAETEIRLQRREEIELPLTDIGHREWL